MRFDLSDLRLFLAIVDAGSITHGASAANLSLAAASARLRDMEAAGGVLLVDRSRRGITPTRPGEALAHHARLVLRQVGAMQLELSEHARGIRGSVRMLANSAAITEFLPDRLGPFLSEHRRIDIDLAERPSPEIVKAIAGGLAEIGIVSSAVHTGALETLPFAIDRLVAVMARTHPMASSKRIAFDQIVGEDHIGFSGALQRYIDEQAQQVGAHLRYRICLQTFDGICRAASMGGGIGIVPENAARRARRLVPLSIVRLSDAWATRRLLLCCRNAAALDPMAHQLLTYLSSSSPAETV